MVSGPRGAGRQRRLRRRSGSASPRWDTSPVAPTPAWSCPCCPKRASSMKKTRSRSPQAAARSFTARTKRGAAWSLNLVWAARSCFSWRGRGQAGVPQPVQRAVGAADAGERQLGAEFLAHDPLHVPPPQRADPVPRRGAGLEARHELLDGAAWACSRRGAWPAGPPRRRRGSGRPRAPPCSPPPPSSEAISRFCRPRSASSAIRSRSRWSACRSAAMSPSIRSTSPRLVPRCACVGLRARSRHHRRPPPIALPHTRRARSEIRGNPYCSNRTAMTSFPKSIRSSHSAGAGS
jgi:hypothetical protein